MPDYFSVRLLYWSQILAGAPHVGVGYKNVTPWEGNFLSESRFNYRIVTAARPLFEKVQYQGHAVITMPSI